MRALAILILLLFPMAFAKTYCLDNNTLVIEQVETSVVNDQEINMTVEKKFSCPCQNGECANNKLTIFEALLVLIPFILTATTSRILSILGSIGLILFGFYFIASDIVAVSNGIPMTVLNYNMVKILSFVLIGYALISLFFNIFYHEKE